MLNLKCLGARPHFASWFNAKPLSDHRPLFLIEFYLMRWYYCRAVEATVSNRNIAIFQWPAHPVYYITLNLNISAPRQNIKNLEHRFWAIYVRIMLAIFQPSSFKTVGGDRGDIQTRDVTPHPYTKFLNSPPLLRTGEINFSWTIKNANRNHQFSYFIPIFHEIWSFSGRDIRLGIGGS